MVSAIGSGHLYPIAIVHIGSVVKDLCTFFGVHMNLIRQSIGVSRSATDAIWLAKAKPLYENPFGLVGNLLLCLSDFGSLLPFLHYCRAIDLTKIAGVFGQVRFLAPFMELSIGSVLSVIACVGHFYVGIDAIERLRNPDVQGPFRRQAWIELANGVMQIALSVLILTGTVNNNVLVPLGAVCLVMGSISFLHRAWLPPDPVIELKKRPLMSGQRRPMVYKKEIQGNRG
jgi:hypothetical protein